MTKDEAYKLICEEYKAEPTIVKHVECIDAHRFFLGPPGSKVGERNFVGSAMTAVDKATKRVYIDENWSKNILLYDLRNSLK